MGRRTVSSAQRILRGTNRTYISRKDIKRRYRSFDGLRWVSGKSKEGRGTETPIMEKSKSLLHLGEKRGRP